jgi:hypothetical protein
VLASGSLLASRKWQAIFDLHVGLLLLALVAVFAYVDLRPLAVVGELPSQEATITAYIIHFGALCVVGVFIPLTIPGPQSSVSIVHSAFTQADSLALFRILRRAHRCTPP